MTLSEILTPLPLWHMFFFCGNFYKAFELHLCPIDLLLFSMRLSLLCGRLLYPRSHTLHKMDVLQSMHREPFSMPFSKSKVPHPTQRHASPCVALSGPGPQRSHTTQPLCQRVAWYGSGGIGRGGSLAWGGLQSGEEVLNTVPHPMSRGVFIKPLDDLFQGF